jgi:AT-hook transcription factor
LLIGGAIVPGKRPRGRPRKDVVAIGANAWAAAADLAQTG